MPFNLALYYSDLEHLAPERMGGLSESVKPEVAFTTRGLTYTYRMTGVTAIISEMPAAQIAPHLVGFERYVRSFYKNRVPAEGDSLISRIRSTKLVVGFELQPDLAEAPMELLEGILEGADPLIFYEGSVFNSQHQPLLDILSPSGG